MSLDVLKLFPAEPDFVPPVGVHARAVEELEALLPDGAECEATVHKRLEFIDQGENLDRIECPRCKKWTQVVMNEQVADWWHEVTDRVVDDGPEGLEMDMPCCNAKARFTELEFDWPGGFARFELSIEDPNVAENLPPESVARIESILGCKLKQVRAHY